MEDDTGTDTGGNDHGGSSGSWDDESSSTLWGWLDSVVGGLKTVWETLTSLPGLIWDKFQSAFDDIGDWLSDIWDSISELPTLILNGIKDIFIPDSANIKQKFLDFVEDFGTIFGANFDAFNNLFEAEKPLEDVTVDVNIPGVGNFNLTILDKEWVHKGVAFFRPIIRGWLTLLLVIFVWNNTLGLIRQSMPIAHSTPSETESITISKSEKLAGGFTKTTSTSTRRRK